MKNYNQIVDELNKVQYEVHDKYDALLGCIDKLRADALTAEQERKANEYEYQFTKEQLIELLLGFYNDVIGQVADKLHEFEVDDSAITIEWRTYGNTAEAELDIDQSSIQSGLQDHVEEMYLDKNTIESTQLEIMLNTATEHITK